jgi:hypothetical protein
MSLCAKISSRNFNKTKQDINSLKPTESEKFNHDKRNSFNYNFKRCKTLSDPEFAKYNDILRSQMKQPSNNNSQLNNMNNLELEKSTMVDYNEHSNNNKPVIREADIVLEEQKPRYIII